MHHRIVPIALIALFGGMTSNYVLACSTVVGWGLHRGQQLSAGHNAPQISQQTAHHRMQQGTVTAHVPRIPNDDQKMPVKETNKP